MEFFVPPGTDEEWHQYWIDERLQLVHATSASRRTTCAFSSTRRRSSSHYSKRTVDVEYRFQFTGSEWGELEGVANRTRLRPDGPRQAERRRSVLLRPGDERALDPVRHRAGCGSRPRRAGVPARCLRGRRGAQHQGRGRQAHRAAPRPAAGAGQGCGAAALARQRALARRPRRRGRAAQAVEHRVRRRGRHRSALPAAGRDRYAVLASPSTSTRLDDQAVTVRERDSMRQERVGLDALRGYLSERLEP